MALNHSGLRDSRPVPRTNRWPQVIGIRAIDAVQMPFVLLRLTKKLRRAALLVRIWPDAAFPRPREQFRQGPSPFSRSTPFRQHC